MEPEATDTTTVYTIDQIRDIVVPYARDRGMRWARVFGSYARGEATGESDIDVLVDLGDARALSLFGLMEHIWESTGKRPDVYDVAELLPGPFRDEVMREAVAL